MKNKIAFLSLAGLFLLTFFASADMGARHGFPAGLLTFFVLDALMASVACYVLQVRVAGLFTATLILPILTGKVMAAFKTKVPELDFFSTDYGKSGTNFAAPTKFNQEIISQIAQIPTVSDYTPGDDLTSSSQNVKDLVSDVKVKIDRGRVVKLKLPAVDVNTLLLMPAFMQLVEEAGQALGRDVVATAVGQANAANFSQSKTKTTNSTDLDTLEDLRVQHNQLGTLTPRYVLGSSDFCSKIQNDPRVMGNQFYNQRTTDDPYTSLVNIKGFKEVREFPNFAAAGSTTPADTFTAATSDVVTPTSQTKPNGRFEFNNGDRVRLTTSGTLPAALALATDYYVILATATTLKLSATLGGSAVDITDTGTGTHTMTRAENLNAFSFEKRAIHIAIRPPMDAIEMARSLGIPVPILSNVEVDPITGLSFAAFMFIDMKQDIYVAFAAQFGVRAGRGLAASADPSADPAGTALDYAGIRVITA